MKPPWRLLLPGIAAALVAGCTSTISSPTPTPAPVEPTPIPSAEATPPETLAGGGMEPITDGQGAVVVVETPLDVKLENSELIFELVMDTHSVELGMDLTRLAVLRTDSGLEITPSRWEGPQGGHHVDGRLIFPGQVDGQPILDGAQSFSLVLRGVEVPERVFTWSLTGG